ncbi:MAG: hypothetical protein GXO25_06180 [Euryarchaeota archaeon]|nr:hypothetical protein [Euryarchaeota archaeon]
MKIINTQPFDCNIFKISWTVYLVNDTVDYQANNYQVYYPIGSRIIIPAGKSISLTIVDNTSTHQWTSWVLHNLKWQLEKYGSIKYIKWRNTVSVYCMLGNFNGEKYRYNYRTWYLWYLPEVEISYDKTITAS